jgi:hypothetical protein
MRMPGRLHITWENDTTLRLDTDAGTQTRRFLFEGAAADGRRTWQGTSRARWTLPVNRAPGARAGGPGGTGHQLSLMCDDIRATVAELRGKGIVINGEPGIAALFDGRLISVISIRTDGHRILGVYSILNPDKLRAFVPGDER